MLADVTGPELVIVMARCTINSFTWKQVKSADQLAMLMVTVFAGGSILVT